MIKLIKKIFLTIILLFLVMPWSNTVTYANSTAKILVIGNFSCGKTQMCRLMCGFCYSESSTESTSEVCRTFNISEIDTTVRLWDTIALDLDYSRTMELAGKADVVFVLHDTEKPFTSESFEYIGKLYRDLASKVSPGCKLVPICTKSDTKAKNIVNFTKNYRQMKDVFELLGYDTIFIVSSKTGEGFDKIREYLKVTLPLMNLPQEAPESIVSEDPDLFKRIEELKRLKKGIDNEDSTSVSEQFDKTWYETWKKLKF